MKKFIAVLVVAVTMFGSAGVFAVDGNYEHVDFLSHHDNVFLFPAPAREQWMPPDDFDISAVPILINGKEIDAPPAFLHYYEYGIDGRGVIIMVPLRAIAEALGYGVSWNSWEHSVGVYLPDNDTATNRVYRLAVGGTYVSYSYFSADDVTGGFIGALFPAPVVVDNITYVPLSFFAFSTGLPPTVRAVWTANRIWLNSLER